jgi:Amt family ammonium transporter
LKGLFYGGGTTLLTAQFIGSAITTVATFAVAFAVMKTVNAMGYLRVEAEGEHLGIDVFEHGISAYPEYVISRTASPSATVYETGVKFAAEPRLKPGTAE